MDSRWWLQLAVVGVGGFVGAVARYGISGLTHKAVGHGFPAGTLVVNAIGCLLIGFVLFLALERGHFSASMRLLIVTGFLGSLTTFSTFGHETMMLLREGRGLVAMSNIAANVVLGLVAVSVGWGVAYGAVGESAEASKARLFEAREIEYEGRVYGYRVYTPEGVDGSNGLPGIVFLHGARECGTDNEIQIDHGLVDPVAETPGDWPFVVIVPQKPERDKQWEEYGDLVMAMIEESVEHDGLDADRVALTGLSQGGHGTWTIAAKYPGKFRALMPVCSYAFASGDDGGIDPEAENVKELVAEASRVPVWLFHSADDDVVPVAQSIGMAEAIRAAGGQAELTIVDGVGHAAWGPAYATPRLSGWFMKVTAARD